MVAFAWSAETGACVEDMCASTYAGAQLRTWVAETVAGLKGVGHARCTVDEGNWVSMVVHLLLVSSVDQGAAM